MLHPRPRAQGAARGHPRSRATSSSSSTGPSAGFESIDPEAERILLSYPWPGNIRELRNLFERIVLLNHGDRIQATHLNAAIGPAPPKTDSELSALRQVVETGHFPENGIDLEGALGAVEREIIQRAFDWTRGNQSRTATLLQMKRDKLRYRMKLYGFHDANERSLLDD